MKKIFILLVLLFSTSVSSLAWGSENYDDCILKNLKGIGSDVGAREIIDLCKVKHRNEATFSICFEKEAKIINGIIFLHNINEPFTGNNQCKYIEGQVKSRGSIKDGKLDGKLTEWYRSGQKGLERNYKNGNLDGMSTRWFDQEIWLDGQIKSEEFYIEGNLVGETKYLYHENGQKGLEKNYKDGKLDGKWTNWYENGLREGEEYYKDGKKDAKWSYWYENGQIKSDRNYNDSKKDGKWSYWYENGQMKSQEYFKDGKKDGKWTDWYENGQIKSESGGEL